MLISSTFLISKMLMNGQFAVADAFVYGYVFVNFIAKNKDLFIIKLCH